MQGLGGHVASDSDLLLCEQLLSLFESKQERAFLFCEIDLLVTHAAGQVEIQFFESAGRIVGMFSKIWALKSKSATWCSLHDIGGGDCPAGSPPTSTTKCEGPICLLKKGGPCKTRMF